MVSGIRMNWNVLVLLAIAVPTCFQAVAALRNGGRAVRGGPIADREPLEGPFLQGFAICGLAWSLGQSGKFPDWLIGVVAIAIEACVAWAIVASRTSRRSTEPPHRPTWRSGWLAIAALAFTGSMVVSLATRPPAHRFSFQDFVLIGLQLELWVVGAMVFVATRAWRGWVPQPTSGRIAALVLLPVVGLAAFGIVGLRHDQSATLLDAQRASKMFADQMAEVLGNLWPSQIDILRPDRKWAPDPETASVPVSREPTALGRMPLEVIVGDDGRLVEPPPFVSAPVPARWLAALSPAARDAYGQLQSGGYHGETNGSPADAMDRFERGARDAEAKANAAWIRLLGESRGLAADEASRRCVAFAGLHADDGFETGAGLSLAAVALSEAFRIADHGVPGTNWYPVLEILATRRPGSLTERLVALGAAASARSASPDIVHAERRFRAKWEVESERREFFVTARQAGFGGKAAPRCGWIKFRGEDWFVDDAPFDSGDVMFVDFRMIRTAEHRVRIRALPAEVVAATGDKAGRLLWTSGGFRGLPPGARVVIGLEGRDSGIRFDGPLATRQASSVTLPVPDSRLLAHAESAFSLLISGPKSVGDDWPSHPRISVSIVLEDPALLFAARVRQSWILAGVILVAAGVSVVGVVLGRRAFLRLQALNEEKTNFVSSVSHELRAPLASLRLLAEGLAEGRGSDEAKRREYAGFLVQETRRLGAVVENILDLSRIEQGRKSYEFAPTDLARLVSETARIHAPVAEQRGVRIECHVPGQGIEILADGPSVQQALLNLIDNALKHAPPGSAVGVTLEPVAGPGGLVRIVVSDSGPGIPPEDRERVFERFYRRGSELRRETQGIGLGLALVRHIAEAHGGRAWVADGPGTGATVCLELPAGGPR
jgi:signal transduction histidine kinase